MKTVLVTGANGLLGHKLCQRLENLQGINLVATSLGEQLVPVTNGKYIPLDITNNEMVQTVISEVKPDVIINSAAMTHVDKCESEKEMCTNINVKGVQNLINAGKPLGTKLIHVSTDFIFDGTAGPYKEDDLPNPLSHYGKSKLDSEKIILESGIDYAIARTILIYGVIPDLSRSNIVLWAKGALQKGTELTIVNDQVRSPTLAEDLADGLIRILTTGSSGVYNLSGPESMTILELVQRVANYWKMGTENISEINTESLNQTAKRPPVTGFDIQKAMDDLGYFPHILEEGLEIVDQQLKELELA